MDSSWLSLPCHERKLAKPILASNIGKANVLEFTRSEEDYLETYDADHDYEVDEVAKFTKLEMLEGGDTGSALDKFKQAMVPFPYGPDKTVDNRMMKKIKEKGFGNSPTPGCQVKVHYMYYTDLVEIPIDITYLRKKIPEKFRLGSVIPAFEYCILSMKKGEKADFFAGYEHCFRERGCPPRIPPKADLLLEIHLVDFSTEVEEPSTAELEPQLSEGYKQPDFKVVLKNAQALGASAKISFNNKNIIGAIKLYKEAARSLYNTKVDNHEDEMDLQETLCKMYRNLMVCHNDRKQYPSTCSAAKNALQYASHYAAKDVKLFFLWGKALNGLQEWKSAIDKLKKAISLATKNSERAQIGKEIQDVEAKLRKYEKQEKEMCSRMLVSSEEVERIAYREDEPVRPATLREIHDNKEEQDEFQTLMEEVMRSFKMSEYSVDKHVVGITSEFNREEVDVIKKLAARMNLVCTIDREIVLTKPY